MTRWPKPREGATCEASVGMDPKSYQPRILLCRKPATEIAVLTKLGIQTTLCEEHAISLAFSGVVRRKEPKP